VAISHYDQKEAGTVKRPVLAAATALLALLAAVPLAGAAAPAQGRLIVVAKQTNVGANGGVTIHAIQAPNTYRTTVYVPEGYRAPGGLGKVGNQVGTVTLFAQEADGSRVTMTGTLTAADPARYVGVDNPFKQDFAACAGGSGEHSAVWVVDAQQTGGAATARFPIFVDDTATTDTNDAPWATYRLRWCATASANVNLPVTTVALSLVKMFVNPQSRGMYLWRAVYDPTTSDGKTIASDDSVSVASAVPISAQVSARSTRLGAHIVRISGHVLAGTHPLAGVRVQVFVGRQQRVALNRPAATTRTRADGTYSVTVRVARGVHWLRAKASTPYLDITPGGGCAQEAGVPQLAGRGCVDATLAPFVVVSKPVLRLA
jgi:hypothetical protein